MFSTMRSLVPRDDRKNEDDNEKTENESKEKALTF